MFIPWKDVKKLMTGKPRSAHGRVTDLVRGLLPGVVIPDGIFSLLMSGR